MISGILTILIFICPLFIGFLFHDTEKKVGWGELAQSYLSGQFLLWGSFQLIAVPLIHLRASFDTLFFAFLVLFLTMVIWGIMKASHCTWNLSVHFFKSIVVWILLLAIIYTISIPVYKYIFLEHTDQDDARFIVEANDALFHNTMFLHSPVTGEYNGRFIGEIIKDVNSPWPMYIAFLSKATMIHPATMAHTIYAPILVLFSYLVYWKLGSQLFAGIHERLTFLLAVSIINLYFAGPAIVEGAPPVHMMTRIWQGKSVVQCIAMPAIFLQFILLYQEPGKRNWLLLITMSIASSLLSGMGIILSLIAIAVYGAYRMICKRFNGILWLLTALAPPIIYEIIYLQMGR